MVMLINDIMEKKKITQYKLSKESGVPYSTINDIFNGRTSLAKCTAETVYRIAKVLDLSMEELLSDQMENRMDFELFKSQVCHQFKELGDINFMINLLEGNDIRKFYDKKWYRESFYLLAMLDLLSKENGLSLCREYDDLRYLKLESLLFPKGVLIMCKVMNDESYKTEALNAALEEFLRYNIVEGDIRNVV